MRRLKRVAIGLILLIAFAISTAWLTSRPGDPALYPSRPGANNFDVFIVSHGYHAGIVLRRADVAEFARHNGSAALLAVAERFPNYAWLEIGWGDEGFYREVPDISALTIGLAFKALFLPGNRSVLHVVGLSAEPRVIFTRSEMLRLRLGEESFEKLLRALEASFAREANGQLPNALGRGLYGPSLFYRAVGEFSVLNVCNHWVANILDRAGVPTTPLVDTLPQGLLFDLKWRAGAVALPAPLRRDR